MDYTIIIVLLGILFLILYLCYLDSQEKARHAVQDSCREVDELSNYCEEEPTCYDMLKGLGYRQAFLKLQGFGHIARKIKPDFPILTESHLQVVQDKGECSSIGERICLDVCEQLFNKSFKKVRPDWLRNDKTNRCMELDGYCEELKLGIEYNGSQHYNYPNFTNNTFDEFREQLYRDQRKNELCYNRGVCLINVPYNIPHKKLPLYIYSKLLDTVAGAPDIYE